MSDIVKSDNLPVLRRKDMSTAELRSVTCWSLCDGDRGRFEDMEKRCNMNKRGKRPLWHLLHTDKVRRFIDQMVVAGKCLPLVMDKPEVEMELSCKIRKTGNNHDIKEFNSMRGYIPKDGQGGGTIVQIMLTGQIGQIDNGDVIDV